MNGSAGAQTILGLDTATAAAAVGVARGDDMLAERRADSGPDGRPRHASALMAEVEAAVATAGGWGEIDLIAVGVGPGTFTGLRIGIATARGLAQARGLPVTAVDSLAALARGIEGAPKRPRLAAVDARRGELFAGLYSADGAAIWEPFVADPEAVAIRLADAPAAPLAAGDGSLRFRAQLEAAGVEVLADANPAHLVAARHVCALGARGVPGRPEQVKPIYLRRPDAEVWRERRK